MEQNNTENVSAQNNTSIFKRWWFWVIVVVVVVALIIVLVSDADTHQGIKIVDEQFIASGLQATKNNSIFPIVQVTIKNTSNTTKTVWFDVNFYANGELISSDSSTLITLAPGDQATLKAQSSHGYSVFVQKEYSYKITNWSVYDK